MKTIRLSVTDAEHAAHKAARRNERVARRALGKLKSLTHGQRHYNLKTDGDYVGVFATLTDFDVTGYTDGVDVYVNARLRPFDDTGAARLADIARAASEASENVSDALLRSLPASMKRDITTLLDWVSPEGVPLMRHSIFVYVEAR